MEAFVKTVIRQIVAAKTAKRVFSDFIERYGYHRAGAYDFPSPAGLRSLRASDLRLLGLGFRADRIVNGFGCAIAGETEWWRQVPGIGPWSQQVLTVETKKDYSFYPFGDRSGLRIKAVCGIALEDISRTDSELAGDLYVYGSAFLGAMA
jgi:3-methyladenine DNA glycosylase/8-oxoguanine DNA glycosylase